MIEFHVLICVQSDTRDAVCMKNWLFIKNFFPLFIVIRNAGNFADRALGLIYTYPLSKFDTRKLKDEFSKN